MLLFTRVCSRAQRVHPVFDELIGEAELRWKIGKFVDMEPFNIVEFCEVWRRLTASVACLKADHELAGKRPGLAAKIADIGNLDAGFLSNLAYNTPFQRFSRLHKAGEDTVALAPTWLVREQDVLAIVHQRQHSR